MPQYLIKQPHQLQTTAAELPQLLPVDAQTGKNTSSLRQVVDGSGLGVARSQLLPDQGVCWDQIYATDRRRPDLG